MRNMREKHKVKREYGKCRRFLERRLYRMTYKIMSLMFAKIYFEYLYLSRANG